jgi:transposase
LGLPYSLHSTTANISDRAGAVAMFENCKNVLPQSLQTILADSGYTGENFANDISKFTKATVQIAKRSELHTFAVIPKRWIVERSFAWLDKCRRLWKNCERSLQGSLNMVKFAFVSLLLKRL